MALASENLRVCGVKINASVCGVPSVGSGVVYVTPNYCNYNYVLTAKHIFQEESITSFQMDDVLSIEILHSTKDEFKRLQYIKKEDVQKNLITFEEDFAVIIINKNEDIVFRPILVSDSLEDSDLEFFSWATFSANLDKLHKFNFKRDDIEVRRFKSTDNLTHTSLPGMSGAGMFIGNKNILNGIICKYPNEDFENDTIDCSDISFSKINKKLKSLERIELDTEASSHKREIKDSIIDIHQVYINNVCLNLESARRRLKTDIEDDWYHDPLKYIDLLNQDYFFKQFEDLFQTDNYEACRAEEFYAPKKKLTLRQALTSPFIDRLMYMATVGVLAEKLDSDMISNVYSARYNRYSENHLIINGVEQWKKMKYKLAECANLKDAKGNYVYNCVIEIDLLNFYDNINKNLLYKKILRICETQNEKNAAKLLKHILSKFSKKDLGLPQNSDASSLLASFYLNQVDVFMEHQVTAYYRFMDDIRIFCSDKYEARKILQTFEYELRRCHLSVNSQKTNIISFTENENPNIDENNRNKYNDLFDLELNKISRLRRSENYAYLNDAFHLSLKLLQDNFSDADLNDSDDSARRLNYALNTIALLGKKDINLYSEQSQFKANILTGLRSLIDKPWITSQLCKVLNLISSEEIKNDYIEYLEKIVLEEKYNTYSFQTYQVWLLLAKHKCTTPKLRKYAVRQIEKNDETNKAVIASMIIYMCSIDNKYRKVLLRKFNDGFTTHGYFQNRIALISLRAFDEENIEMDKIHKTLSKSHEFTNKYKYKDLVFVQGFDEDDASEESFEQLYSI
ncbi:RNA-directed DNA polymerase [Flavobacterium sp. CAU 1735]|uniref:RNA-directed DNA polymerase n=1 Tax=Flavobacterium sp. CAU 1735 TaxID=3140361 RepID=UPI0032617015